MEFDWKVPKLFVAVSAVLLFAVLLTAHINARSDPLPSWNNGPAKQAVIDFVNTTTDQSTGLIWA